MERVRAPSPWWSLLQLPPPAACQTWVPCRDWQSSPRPSPVRKGEGPGVPRLVGAQGAGGWQGTGVLWLAQAGSAPRTQVLAQVLLRGRGVSVFPGSGVNPHGMLGWREVWLFPGCRHIPSNASPLRLRKVFWLQRKTYKCDQKVPTALATRNKNKGRFKIKCF